MSKSKARLSPAKLFAHDEFMDRARKEKRVTRTEISMKHLKPDTSLQARVNTLDTEHVRKLHGILKDGLELAPIVVFEIGDHEYKIADGFHRYEAVRREGRPAITCDVVKGTLQEAIEYAASCNREMCLPRQQEDIGKAIYMLLDNGWFDKTAVMIATQVGCSNQTANKYRTLYCNERRITPPPMVVNAAGKLVNRRRRNDEPPRLYACQESGRTRYRACVGGTQPTLGYSEAEAMESLKRLTAGKLRPLASVTKSCARADIALLPVSSSDDTALHRIAGRRTQKSALASLIAGDLSDLLQSIARVLLIAAHFSLERKVVIKERDDHAFEGIIEVAGKLGVEFLTLDQFIASEKDAAQ